jgi:ABC-2 type transport system permease protein
MPLSAMAERMGPAPVAKARGWRLFWGTVWARSYPRMIGMNREKSWMFFDTFLPILGVSAYVMVYRSLGSPPEYVGYVVLGGAMTAFWLNVLWSMASQLYWDKDQGNLELYVVSPAPLMGILLGMALGGMVASALRATVILLLGTFLFDVSWSISNIWLLLGIFALTLSSLYGMGMMFASVFLVAGREAWHLSNLLQEPIYLVSGLYFPVRSLGVWVATFASIIPLTLGLDAMRQLMFEDGASMGFLPVPLELAILAVLTVVFVGAAWWALDRLEEVGRRDGRLIERRT